MEQGKEFFIGLDLGGTSLKYALGTSGGDILIKDEMDSKADRPQKEVFEVIFKAIKVLREEAKTRGGFVAAIGLGSPGAVDFEKGKLKGNTPNFLHWGDAEIKKTIEAEFAIPCWADNDANVMAFAESRKGAGKGANNVIALTLGTGIGGGILIDGQLFRGTRYAGAELGHITIDYDGEPCNCGGYGCVEKYASAPAMVKNYIEKLTTAKMSIPDKVSTKIIFARAKEGEKQALETIDDTCKYLGAALASIINIFNPEIIVIGGGVADAGDEFMRRIWAATTARTMKPSLEGLKLVRAKMGNDAGVVGAICMASEMYYSQKRD
ncbi:ROK family protein [candidate division KSB1 bacterium]|nr:ROK family protein [candidate division KSB1 bacterium]